MYIAMTSDSMTRGQLHSYAGTQVGQRISIVPGVSRVDVIRRKFIHGRADRRPCGARHINRRRVERDQERDELHRAGQFDGSSGTALLRPQGQLKTAEQYNELIVGASDGSRSICATSPRRANRFRTNAWTCECGPGLPGSDGDGDHSHVRPAGRLTSSRWRRAS